MALCCGAFPALSQSNERENAVLQKIKSIYKAIDTAILAGDAEKAAAFYKKKAPVYPVNGKPMDIIDALLARTDQFQLAKSLSVKTSTKTIKVKGNSATVNATVTVVAVVPQRGFPDRTVTVKIRSLTEDSWVYEKGWVIKQVRSLQDQMWFDGVLQGKAKKK